MLNGLNQLNMDQRLNRPSGMPQQQPQQPIMAQPQNMNPMSQPQQDQPQQAAQEFGDKIWRELFRVIMEGN